MVASQGMWSQSWSKVGLFIISLCSTVGLADVDGKLKKISRNRTVAIVQLAGTDVVGAEATFKAKAEGKELTGRVAKIIGSGKAVVRFNTPLPASMAAGDLIEFEFSGGSGNGVELKAGGAKVYWEEVSHLSMHRAEGLRVDSEYRYAKGTGERTSEGGSINDDTTYGVSDTTQNLSIKAGYGQLSGLGGGLWLGYRNEKDVKESEIEVAGVTGDENLTTTIQTQRLRPYVNYILRPNTKEIGIGAGIGYIMNTSKRGIDYELAGSSSGSSDATLTEKGLALELGLPADNFGVYLQIAPSLTGKSERDSQEYSHKASEYGMVFETYNDGRNGRVQFLLTTSEDEVSGGGTVKTSGYKISLAGDLPLTKRCNITPNLDYISTKATGDDDGTATEIDLGARFAKSGRYSPFFGMGVTRSQVNDPGANENMDVRDTVTSYRLSLGLVI